MANDDRRISDLTTAGTINNDDLMEISTVNQSSDTGYSSVKATIAAIATKILGGIQYAADLVTSSKTIFGAINELHGTVLSSMLTSGSTTLVFQDVSITVNSTLQDVYTSVFGVVPTDAVFAAGSLTLTFQAQDADINVKVRIT